MLIVPDSDDRLRIVSFDPGTDTLGSSVLELNVRTLQLTVLDAQTFVSRRPIRYRPGYQRIEEIYGDRLARLSSHRQAVMGHLHRWQPHVVACESPFMGMRAQAFEALIECVNVIRWAVHDFDPTVPVEMITPPQAKKTVGASFKGSDKNDVRLGIQSLFEESNGQLVYRAYQPFDQIDEHSIDAIAVGVCHYQQWVEFLTH
jgi:Holliday junction resolvasome RuvABC endonuclease subunit